MNRQGDEQSTPVVEVAFRAYDLCFGWAMHSLLGQMLLEITIRNAAGKVLDRLKQFY